MFLKIAHVRLALALAGLVVLVGYFAAGGSFGQKSSIIIEFGIDPREFNGLEVEIDGKVVGKLQAVGAMTRTAFPVKDGEHTVRVLHPTYPCAVHMVTTGPQAHQVMLIVDFAEMTNAAGRPEVMVTFQ